MGDYYGDAQFEINETERQFGGQLSASDHVGLAIAKALLSVSEELSGILHHGINQHERGLDS